VLLDVRPSEQFNICHLPGSINAPWKHFEKHVQTVTERAEAEGSDGSPVPLHVVCRRGNDSQRAVAFLHDLGFTHAFDMVGGVEGWAREVDPGFPIY